MAPMAKMVEPNKLGHDDREHVRQDFAEDDPEPALAAHLGRGDEILLAQGERLRAQHARAGHAQPVTVSTPMK